MRLASLAVVVVTGSLSLIGAVTSCASGETGGNIFPSDAGTNDGTAGSSGSGGSGGSWPGDSGTGGHAAYDSGWPSDAGNECADGEQRSCYSGPPGTEGVGVCVMGNETCQGGVWSDCGGQIIPTDEQCNGLDDDCDGLADEEMGQTTCGLGNCQVTVENCVNGHPETCTPKTGNATEQCDGTDDNCDGQVDEGCSCLDGQKQACYTADPATKDVGECKGGTQTCSGGQWGTCAGEVKPVAEKCNGLDDDCDAQTDEGNPQGGQTCSTGKLGVCSAGSTSCVSGSVICNQLAQASPEVCDGQDNNCNGSVDDGNPEGGKVCNTGKPGICGPGTTQCKTGAVACVQNKQPVAEICDTIDNDCDGQVDEGCNCVNGTTQTCYTGPSGTQGIGICKSGTQTCSSGNWGSCVGQVVPGVEVCDGSDNDCDGTSDESNPGGGGSCSTGKLGICATGTQMCQSGVLGCVQNQQPINEVCNNSQDDDCDGQTDEGCSVGACVHDKCSTGPNTTTPLVSGCDPCVTQVCAADSYCCTFDWDSICVSEVRTICNSLKCDESKGSCSHTLCATGTALVSGCDSTTANCVSAICNADPFCCNATTGSWDTWCVSEVQTYCSKNCN